LSDNTFWYRTEKPEGDKKCSLSRLYMGKFPAIKGRLHGEVVFFLVEAENMENYRTAKHNCTAERRSADPGTADRCSRSPKYCGWLNRKPIQSVVARRDTKHPLSAA